MSSPTPGRDPDHPEDGAPHGRPWGAPPPPAPGWSGPPAGYAAPPGRRPPQVLVAAILGFVVAFFALLGSLALFALASLFGLLAVVAVLYLALAAVNVWGGVVALQGRNSGILKTAGLVSAGLAVLGMLLALGQNSFDYSSVLLVAAGAGIFALLNHPASQEWFASRGAR